MAGKHPDSELIEAIGRPVLREAFGLSHQRLHHWTVRGVPLRMLTPVARLAESKGVPVPEGFLAPLAELVA